MQSEVLFNVRSNSGKICPPNFWHSQQSVLSFAVPNPGWRERRWVLFCKKPFMVILREGILSNRGKRISQEARALNTVKQLVFHFSSSAARDTGSSSSHALPVGTVPSSGLFNRNHISGLLQQRLKWSSCNEPFLFSFLLRCSSVSRNHLRI